MTSTTKGLEISLKCKHQWKRTEITSKMKLTVSILVALWCISLSFGYAQVDDNDNGRVLPKRFSKLRKRQDDLGYLEQCSILQFWDKQIGRVNVLAFFDSSWQFSHRQAAMLRVLQERFSRTGFENIQFFAVNAAPGEGQYINKAEIELEEETWKQISPSEADGLPPVVISPEALIEALGPNIYFIQDTDELQIWSKLKAFRDQILVIDRCGKLTYQVIVPWSILHFPYVKAAILSTYKDEPCGQCQYQESFDKSTNVPSDEIISSDEFLTMPPENENSKETNSDESLTIIPQTKTDQFSQKTEVQQMLNLDSKTDNSSSVSEEYVRPTFGQNSSHHTSLEIDESSTIDTQTKQKDLLNEQTSFKSEEISTLITKTEFEQILSSSEKATTLLAQIENEQISLSSEESSTWIAHNENDQIPSEFEETSTSFTKDNYDESIAEDLSTQSDLSLIDDSTEPNLLEPTIIISMKDSLTENFNKTSNETDSYGTKLDTSTSKIDSIKASFHIDTYNASISDTDTIVYDGNEKYEEVNSNTSFDGIGGAADNVESTTENVDIYKVSINVTGKIFNITEKNSENEYQITMNIPNAKVTRLEDSKKMGEKYETSDALKSRSTNARSVLPNEESENHLEVIEVNSETSDRQDQLDSDYMIPIRIIMRAPHIDELKDQTIKVHEYLVLKTGHPNYHEHLDSVPQDYDEGHKTVYKKSELIKSNFGKDESPGLYGELADYWQNFGNEHTQDSTESNNEDDEERVLEQETSFVDGGVTLKPATILKSDSKENISNHYESVILSNKEINSKSVYDETNNTNEEIDVLDEEAKSKLIAHYSKLLPWLYYVLAK